ncbi:HAD hydrolase, family IIID [Allomyces macrogynus ATCC 38327]|uniref:HAD hydrolase, family IIID n=1 Tax=Allomyces macrogynus (strain ATCC 38327) TaxID=578462 RepID=A0A0L0T0P1_ALLM3|nr:HAD hydrolase, family IIID [Allomyces macrogynus ATCC 38327]|eukprot:KNE68220.1 HAD hydrolase, family IIID [Allomyces macrogynus ATCC 38327]
MRDRGPSNGINLVESQAASAAPRTAKFRDGFASEGHPIHEEPAWAGSSVLDGERCVTELPPADGQADPALEPCDTRRDAVEGLGRVRQLARDQDEGAEGHGTTGTVVSADDSLSVDAKVSNDLPREPILSPATAALLDQYVMMMTIDLAHPPRLGKKLLVLDLDHTLFDCKSSSPNPHDLIRPGTHEFLTTVYTSFDLAIWSQSSRTLLNHKLATLGLLDTANHTYRIAFTLDATAMFPVTPRSRSPSLERAESPTWQSRMHVKALSLIWARFPETWTRATTMHVDDLQRNFALNPRNGIRVDPWFWSVDAALEDVELRSLARYLMRVVAPAEDVTALDHRAWRQHREVRDGRADDARTVETKVERDDSRAHVET